ncbi:hypothetical protein ACG2F4_15185 [Halalkalibaculum sp. DA3122]|uniref:hypothetical protein n=1 Tax=Halalkalibaculum sp. DA3122 TaxID=3373607 RepID=UPI003754896E
MTLKIFGEFVSKIVLAVVEFVVKCGAVLASLLTLGSQGSFADRVLYSFSAFPALLEHISEVSAQLRNMESTIPDYTTLSPAEFADLHGTGAFDSIMLILNGATKFLVAVHRNLEAAPLTTLAAAGTMFCSIFAVSVLLGFIRRAGEDSVWIRAERRLWKKLTKQEKREPEDKLETAAPPGGKSSNIESEPEPEPDAGDGEGEGMGPGEREKSPDPSASTTSGSPSLAVEGVRGDASDLPVDTRADDFKEKQSTVSTTDDQQSKTGDLESAKGDKRAEEPGTKGTALLASEEEIHTESKLEEELANAGKAKAGDSQSDLESPQEYSLQEYLERARSSG